MANANSADNLIDWEVLAAVVSGAGLFSWLHKVDAIGIFGSLGRSRTKDHGFFPDV